MKRTTTNLRIEPALWLALFTREELRKIARAKGIMRGRNAFDCACNLAAGKALDRRVVFSVTLSIE